ncbi:hypothetical protein FHS27_002350 [Rhodopirellula rubra]|uniref:GH16 domain-containing protein n=1 Tax=Aporhodopirellula rubra TaxID=980271 RepID=A0A7W5H652_9BACT|nr:carbohydrate binding domain-containing protein [Aporhodopirellula rubra]MBB3206541.1 hypothetical protein [Aporhodopirellula rubra]
MTDRILSTSKQVYSSCGKSSVTLSMIIALCSTATALCGDTPKMIEDFETIAVSPSVWVVNIPNENASVRLTTDELKGGRNSLELHYHFLSTGSFQYLGIPTKVDIHSPIHALSFWMKGDASSCSYGIQISDASGETHQYSPNSGQGGRIDFAGWKQIAFDIDAGHETWGGDQNGKIDYPIKAITFTIGQPRDEEMLLSVDSKLFFDSLVVDTNPIENESAIQQIAVTSPNYCDDIDGNTEISVEAVGFKNLAAKCWKPVSGLGVDATVAELNLDTNGKGSFMFPGDEFPHGPITIRISGDTGSFQDNCYLQLYNRGGVNWNEGLPKTPPPAAAGMSLVFSDDFEGPVSISSTDTTATYYDHKPPHGWQDFSTLPFTSFHHENNPFLQRDSYLRIRASELQRSSGLISSMKNDASGITARIPCYFECRFIGPNGIGTWPAFWLMTDYMTDHVKGLKNVASDELDIIEAYGGEGPGHPNAFDRYMICPHCWEQGDAGKAIEKRAYDAIKNPIRMHQFGIPSTWFESPHTYGCKVTETDTRYYCDNIEVGRHETLPLSKELPFFFMINLATGGGWPVDLSRTAGIADMYVDYVRVYSGADVSTKKR